MKRVAIFRSGLLPLSETFVLDQARALRDWSPLMMGFRNVAGGLTPVDVPCRIVSRGGRVLHTLRALLARPMPALVAALKESRANLVHVHFGTDATLIWPSVKAAGLPLLVTLHGYDICTRREWWEAGHGGLRLRWYPRRLLQMARHPSVRFVAVSQALKAIAVEYGLPEARISVAYVGVDTERFTPGGPPLSERSGRILFVGRMVEKKAPLLMVRAFAGVRARMADAELVMIGDGPLLGETRRLAAELGLPVVFPGACDSSHVLAHLRESRVLCMPSVTASNGDAEGFGLAILEAQACGVPVVTSARGGAQEGLAHGRTGHAVAEGDLDQLVERLCFWLREDDQASAASIAAWQFARDAFNIRRCTQQLELLYDRSAIAGPA